MKMQTTKDKAIDLRKKGKTYKEIQKSLKIMIPKSTLSNWCRNIGMSEEYHKRVKSMVVRNARIGRKIALVVNRNNRRKYLESVTQRNKRLANALKNKDIARVALSMLYLGEGGKSRKRGTVLFGNSDPFIISLFLRLLRFCYNINENKFRCTLQCRADQNIIELENLWSRVTKVPSSQFYRARIDPRTIGKKSEKKNYKGVCRIDYLSADLNLELMEIPKMFHKGP